MITRLPVALTVAALAAAALSGCVVVPVDSRTGQPLSYAGTRSATPAAPAARRRPSPHACTR